MIATLLPVLQNDIIRCVPFEGNEDFEYLIDLCLGCKYTKVDRRTIETVLSKTEGYFWKIYDVQKDLAGGVIYFCWCNEKLWLHAYKADEFVRRLFDVKLDHGYQAAKLLLDYVAKEITPVIYTMHSIDNRGATILCKRLGFIETEGIKTKYGNYIMMRRGDGN